LAYRSVVRLANNTTHDQRGGEPGHACCERHAAACGWVRNGAAGERIAFRIKQRGRTNRTELLGKFRSVEHHHVTPAEARPQASAAS
jgi:hypothetical protein